MEGVIFLGNDKIQDIYRNIALYSIGFQLSMFLML